MSFFTSLIYYRPHPFRLTGDDLARFMGQVLDTGVLRDGGFSCLKVKFGESVDQDRNGAYWDEEIAPGVFAMRAAEWDLDLSDSPGICAFIDALRGEGRSIYRVSATLGAATEAMVAPITRTKSKENTVNFCPIDLGLQIGPTEVFDLGSDAPVFVGWAGVSLSGNGYLFPWTFRDVLSRIADSPEIQRLASLCRSMWPMPPEKPPPSVINVRRQLGRLWPYDNLDKPWDWYWGVFETG